MSKTFRNTIALAAVLAILFLAFAASNFFADRQESFPEFSNVEKISIAQAGQEFSIENVDASSWVVNLPDGKRKPAEKQKVEDLIAQIKRTQILEQVSNNGENQGKFYGLGESERITVAVKDERGETSFQVGKSKFPGAFLAFQNESTFLASENLRSTFAGNANSFREKNVLHFDSEKVDRVVVELAKGEKLEFSKGEENWESEQVNDFLQKLQDVQTIGFFPASETKGQILAKLTLSGSGESLLEITVEKQEEEFFLQDAQVQDEIFKISETSANLIIRQKTEN